MRWGTNCFTSEIFALLQVQCKTQAFLYVVIVSCNSPWHLISLDNSCSSRRVVGICYLPLNSGSRGDNVFRLYKVFPSLAVMLFAPVF